MRWHIEVFFFSFPSLSILRDFLLHREDESRVGSSDQEGFKAKFISNQGFELGREIQMFVFEPLQWSWCTVIQCVHASLCKKHVGGWNSFFSTLENSWEERKGNEGKQCFLDDVSQWDNCLCRLFGFCELCKIKWNKKYRRQRRSWLELRTTHQKVGVLMSLAKYVCKFNLHSGMMHLAQAAPWWGCRAF